MPSADVYAAALIAACKGTGESLDELAVEKTDLRCKHYVLHAIKAVFPEVDVAPICVALSVPGKPGFFYRSSVWFTLGQREGRKGPIHWWSEDLFAKVVEAAAEARLREEPVPLAAPSVAPLSPSRAKPIAPTVVPRQPAGPLRTRLDAIAEGVGRAPKRPDGADWLTERAIDRGKSRDLLAEAAANTKKLQDAMPKDEGGE